MQRYVFLNTSRPWRFEDLYLFVSFLLHFFKDKTIVFERLTCLQTINILHWFFFCWCICQDTSSFKSKFGYRSEGLVMHSKFVLISMQNNVICDFLKLVLFSIKFMSNDSGIGKWATIWFWCMVTSPCLQTLETYPCDAYNKNMFMSVMVWNRWIQHMTRKKN